MRGAPLSVNAPARWSGIIPADAGSTTTSTISAGLRRDHPRGCGEHFTAAARATPARGSSPRMRGARKPHDFCLNSSGIIPADAGSTSADRTTPRPATDHPRGCGEHQPARRVRKSFTGSSPRMRGAPHAARHDEPCRGIIPADAGSTPGPDGSAARSRDHPRGCGEHGSPWLTNTAQPGSSPRMRGAPADRPVRPPIPGIIPADAGSTRGAPGHGRRQGCDRGIIPADAGSTCS